ncbi:MAG TPA: prephenate dehydratase [Patescibacteria group bacterium]|nr:prephenate dehydratase [Patescibacteria group bacterium]
MKKHEETVIRTGCLGPNGTHSEELAATLFAGQGRRLVLYPCIDAVIQAVADGEVEDGVVPFENSLEGAVNITMDTLVHKVDLFITAEVVWPVKNHLMARSRSGKVKTIVSHPQALAQCRRYLAQHYPGVEVRAMASTAEAAALVASGVEGHAAIGSRRAAQVHDLEIIATDIQDEANNCTRFVVLGRTPIKPVSGKGKTSFVFQIDGEKPGSLWRVLEEFARRDVNLTRIESRPARTGLGEYVFFFDLEGSMADENIRAALDAIRPKTRWYKELGSYEKQSLC